MSGKKQHIVPQFIQRNFSNTDKIYRYNLNPQRVFGTKIGDNYAENYAYAHTDNMDLDTKITQEENNIFKILNKLLLQEMNSEKLIDEDVNRFVLHFFLRNKYIYNGMYEKLQNAIKLITNINENEFINFVNKTYSKNRSLFLSQNMDIVGFQNICRQSIPGTIKKFHDELLNFKNSKLMYELGADTKTAPILNDFKYRIEEKTELICADVLFCSFDSQDKTYSPYIDKNSSYIIFPISKTKLLLLYKDNVVLTNEEINFALTSCCYNSFSIDINNEYYSNISKNIKTVDFYTKSIFEGEIDKRKNQFKNNIYNSIYKAVQFIKNNKQTKRRKK